jgi:hypothetical protein
VKLERKDYLKIIENASVILVSASMLFYGAGKLIQFKGAYSGNLQRTVSELSGMELMWIFFDFSFSFALIIGLLEIIGATLLLIRKTRIIGCLFLSTILINIIIQGVLFDVPAVRSAMFYQLLILVVLWLNKTELITAYKSILIRKQKLNKKKNLIITSVLSLLMAVALKAIEVISF